MDFLVVLGFPTVAQAQAVRCELAGLQQQHLITMDDAVIVSRDHRNRVRLRQAVNTTTAGAISGGFWGSLVGLLVLNPLLGAVVGAGAGAVSGALADFGINDDFMRNLGSTLPVGTAALCLLVRNVTVNRVIGALRSHVADARLLHSSLSHRGEEKLRRVLAKAREEASEGRGDTG